MEEFKIDQKSGHALAQFLQAIDGFGQSTIFRGQANGSLPLVPKAGRQVFYAQRFKDTNAPYTADLEVFENWRRDAAAVTSDLPENDFECLAYAQHYGLATRLLDWTDNSLVALYFAAEGLSKFSGAVFLHRPNEFINLKSDTMETLDRQACLRVRPFDRRLAAQGGCFTYHPNPKETFVPNQPNKRFPEKEKCLGKIVIPGPVKWKLRNDLADIGFNRKTLFPDLDGLSDHYNWKTSNGLTVSNYARLKMTLRKHDAKKGTNLAARLQKGVVR